MLVCEKPEINYGCDKCCVGEYYLITRKLMSQTRMKNVFLWSNWQHSSLLYGFIMNSENVKTDLLFWTLEKIPAAAIPQVTKKSKALF